MLTNTNTNINIEEIIRENGALKKENEELEDRCADQLAEWGLTVLECEDLKQELEQTKNDLKAVNAIAGWVYQMQENLGGINDR